MIKFQMNFESVPCQIIGKTEVSTSSTWHGKSVKQMTETEKLAFKQMFLDIGADDVIFSEEQTYVYNIP